MHSEFVPPSCHFGRSRSTVTFTPRKTVVRGLSTSFKEQKPPSRLSLTSREKGLKPHSRKKTSFKEKTIKPPSRLSLTACREDVFVFLTARREEAKARLPLLLTGPYLESFQTGSGQAGSSIASCHITSYNMMPCCADTSQYHIEV